MIISLYKKTRIFTLEYAFSMNEVLPNYDHFPHLFWKLNALIEKAKLTPKKTVIPTVTMETTPRKSCLNPKKLVINSSTV